MVKALRILSLLVGILLLLSGGRWIMDPAAAAGAVGMDLLAGTARSTQIGDLGTFFLTMSGLVLVGLRRRESQWLFVAASMLACAAILRTVAAVAHDAPLATQFIVPELIGAVILAVTAKFSNNA